MSENKEEEKIKIHFEISLQKRKECDSDC